MLKISNLVNTCLCFSQHVLERGKPHERSQIINKLKGHIVQLSQHKFASNVVEKCLEYGDVNERGLLIEEIIGHNEGNDNLLVIVLESAGLAPRHRFVSQKIWGRLSFPGI
ncbi:Pumilio-like 5 [Vitis vinifera]|uniref:Pumilio-like 5 n=1 Tax=Vitis vinifera TaxID=29760 RepID=A0A438FW21_VITVI|nr:Pumilio-like 5 [Vitis vinifera]